MTLVHVLPESRKKSLIFRSSNKEQELITLWCDKNRSTVQDVFIIVEKYPTYYLLESTGVNKFKVCASVHDVSINSEKHPMFVY